MITFKILIIFKVSQFLTFSHKAKSTLDNNNVGKAIISLEPHSFFNESFVHITIRKCKLQTIDDEAFKDIHVQKIIISNNPLKELKKNMFVNICVNEFFLSRNNIKTIEPGTFQTVKPFGVEYMEILSLSFNKLDVVEKGQFNGLKVRVLELDHNKIKFIEAGSFSNMPHLADLEMIGNKLKRIDTGIFDNMPNMIIMHLANNNIEYIDPYAFENTTSVTLFLKYNKCSKLNKEYFKNSNIEWIFA
ncbi:unnamed protein product [Diabrotica balteata]|uniref:LRR 8 domain containing protein n=1 Tax=Diabrotica balteata TaxID=107213 RepID=A0A9N9TD37_DIABA|nr:unnamed protein product [Diabrotica balteata]